MRETIYLYCAREAVKEKAMIREWNPYRKKEIYYLLYIRSHLFISPVKWLPSGPELPRLLADAAPVRASLRAVPDHGFSVRPLQGPAGVSVAPRRCGRALQPLRPQLWRVPRAMRALSCSGYIGGRSPHLLASCCIIFPARRSRMSRHFNKHALMLDSNFD